jgi:hypothetical protein
MDLYSVYGVSGGPGIFDDRHPGQSHEGAHCLPHSRLSHHLQVPVRVDVQSWTLCNTQKNHGTNHRCRYSSDVRPWSFFSANSNHIQSLLDHDNDGVRCATTKFLQMMAIIQSPRDPNNVLSLDLDLISLVVIDSHFINLGTNKKDRQKLSGIG